MQQVNYIIVGQGLTGTILAHYLLQAGKTFHIIDDEHRGSSSQVAAGIINPVTGRRVVKSWMIDTLIPHAKSTYQEIENKFGIKIFHKRNIVRALFSKKEDDLWLEKTAHPSVEKYILEADDLGEFQNKVEEGYAVGEIQQTAQIDMPLLLETYRDYFLQQKNISLEKISHQAIEFKDGFVFYKKIKAEKIIFCEGHQGRFNPFFDAKGFEVAKGEVLLVKIPNANFQKILKHKLFIVPLKDELYWVGSTYDWEIPNDQPTEEAKQLLIFKLKKILQVPFEVIDHQAAIRPTTFDRRPLIGLHPENELLGMVNGMGTKGASLAPYFVKMFVDFLLENKPILEEVDIQRL